MVTSMRGLNTFITDIRHCPNKESETTRCEKELSKIRSKFNSKKSLSGYQKKKYIWKLLYMHILGYEIDFGYSESSFLINSSRFSEKYTGYIATGILVQENNTEVYKTMANSIRSDLNSSNEVHQSLALAMIGALAPHELVHQLYKDIIGLAIKSGGYGKAIMCLLRMLRKYRELFYPEEWVPTIVDMFESDSISLGYLSALCSLVLGVSNFVEPSLFEDIVPRIVRCLERNVLERKCPTDYLYYSTPSPWLQVKLLKILQLFPPPSEEAVYRRLMDVLTKIIKKTEVTKTLNKNNADHGILFEAAMLVITYNRQAPPELRNETVQLLGVFITVREPNIRYLALETLSKFQDHTACEKLLTDNLKTIISALKDNDISIKRRALEILYLFCTPTLVGYVVSEMLQYVEQADVQFKEELTLKIAILAEKFADDLQWYIDVVVKLVTTSGEFISDDIWYRIIQMITGFGEKGQTAGNTAIQKYATQKIYTAVNSNYVQECLIKIAAYVLTEYSELLVDSGKDPQKIFDLLNKHFATCSTKSKAMLLNGFAKLGTRFPELEGSVLSVFQSHNEHYDPELQQRAIEYSQLFFESEEIRQKALNKMPCFASEIQNNNPLLKRIYQLKMQEKKTNDPTVLLQSKKDAIKEVDMFKSKASPTKKVSDSSLSVLEELHAHPLFEFCNGKFPIDGPNILSEPERIAVGNIKNLAEFKALLSTPNGVVFKNEFVTVQYKSDYQGASGKLAMQFESEEEMTDGGNGIQINMLPIRYAEHPQVMIELVSNDALNQFPIASLFYKANSYEQRKAEFHLPIFPHKFVKPVNMPLSAMQEFYEEYTFDKNPNYFKLDKFIKNPAGSVAPLQEVMNRLGGLFTALNLHVNASPSMENIKEISGTGQFGFRNESDVEKNLPVLIQIQCFEENKEYLRFSLRGAGTQDVIRAYYQVALLFLGV